MRNIIIVECISTGLNYVQDIINRNYNPIVLELKIDGDEKAKKEYDEMLEITYGLIDNEFEIIYEKDTYEENLEMVKKYDPFLIIPGSEKGVTRATKLANDLNLLGNPIENLEAMTSKDAMQKRLAENNLRHIKGKLVSSVKEAKEYYDMEGLKEVVVKLTYGAATVGVNICKDKESMIKAVEKSLTENNIYGEANEDILIQEYIYGEEYVVNTVSCDGVHRVTTIWKYNKIKTGEGFPIYDYDETISELGLGEAELVEYAYDVADAIGIKYGPVHGEYMVDEKGPVLIEVNCRPMGTYLEAKFIDAFSGQHETDSSLDSYMNPEKFKYEQMKGYNLLGHAAMKSFIVPKDVIAKSSPMKHISNKLKSHSKTILIPFNKSQTFVKTQDLETSYGTVFLVHEDPYQIKKDIDYLRSVEKKSFQLVLSEEYKKKMDFDEEYEEEIKSFVRNMKGYGTCMIITDTKYDDLDILQLYPQELKEDKGEFDAVFVNLNKSMMETSDELIAKFILDILDKIKVGGLVFIPKTTYEYMPNGRTGAEALVKALDLKIELPLYNFPKMLIASKR